MLVSFANAAEAAGSPALHPFRRHGCRAFASCLADFYRELRALLAVCEQSRGRASPCLPLHLQPSRAVALKRSPDAVGRSPKSARAADHLTDPASLAPGAGPPPGASPAGVEPLASAQRVSQSAGDWAAVGWRCSRAAAHPPLVATRRSVGPGSRRLCWPWRRFQKRRWPRRGRLRSTLSTCTRCRARM